MQCCPVHSAKNHRQSSKMIGKIIVILTITIGAVSAHVAAPLYAPRTYIARYATTSTAAAINHAVAVRLLNPPVARIIESPVITEKIIAPAPILTARYVAPTPILTAKYIASSPVVARYAPAPFVARYVAPTVVSARYVAPSPVITKYVAPAPVVAKYIAHNPVVVERYVAPAPILSAKYVTSTW